MSICQNVFGTKVFFLVIFEIIKFVPINKQLIKKIKMVKVEKGNLLSGDEIGSKTNERLLLLPSATLLKITIIQHIANGINKNE